MLHHEKGTTPPLFASWYCTPPSPARSRKPARKAAFREGFTLLEMLVVIAVMAMLMGVTFRMMKPSEHAGRVAKTTNTLNLVNAAIAEYHAEYGIYPPVTDPPRQRLVGGNIRVDEDEDGHIPGVAVGYFAPTVNSLANTSTILDLNSGEDDQVFVFGLASFLVDRCDPELKGVDKNGNPVSYDGGDSFLDNIFKSASRSSYFGPGSHWAEFGKAWDKSWSNSEGIYGKLAASGKDANFYRRIRGITKKFLITKHMNDKKDRSGNFYYYTIRDSCVDDGQDLVYICPPPFTTYALFSAGPDGKVVSDDPLNPEAKCSCGQYHNRDNIYSTVNVK